MSLKLSPECRLVFTTAGHAPDPERLASLAGAVGNWPRALVIAERERATSTLWRALATAAPEAMPSDARAHVQRSTMVADFRMMCLRDRLQATLVALRTHGVRVVLLKGAALGASVYRSFPERPMLDVDLLVHGDDALEAKAAVLASGWKERGDPVVERLLEGHHHLPPFLDVQNTGLRLELHTGLMVRGHPFAISDEEVWASARPAPESFAGALHPSPLHLLWHACVHFAWSHTLLFGAWRTFRDAAELISLSLIDWDAFVALATRTRAASACYWTLRLAQRMSDVPVPTAVLRALEPPGPEAFKRALERHFIAEIAIDEGPPCPSVSVSHILWRMAIRPAWSGHGSADRFRAASHWEEELHGVRPDPPTGRVIRHVVGARHWWRFVTRTLMAS